MCRCTKSVRGDPARTVGPDVVTSTAMNAVSATKVLAEVASSVEYRTVRPSAVHVGDRPLPLESCTLAPVGGNGCTYT